MKFTAIAPLLFAAVITSCSSVQHAAQAPDPAEGSMASGGQEAKQDDDREALVRKLELAQARLAVKEMEMAASAQQHSDRVGFAKTEVNMAQAKLAVFRDSIAPQRLASERLNLLSAQDRAQQAADELAQIEIMYKDQDLDDLTAEFVVTRGRRNAERAAQRIEIQASSLARLEQHELPHEERSLALAAEKASSSLRKLKSDGVIETKRNELALTESRNGIADLEKQLAKHDQQQSSASETVEGQQ